MNQLKEEIISLIESRQGFTEISNQLNSEIPQMLLQLRNYYRDDRAFYDIVLQIRNRWGPIFSGKLRAVVSEFTSLYLNELEKLASWEKGSPQSRGNSRKDTFSKDNRDACELGARLKTNGNGKRVAR